jgi:apolipoprotein N-acyltransferase
MQRQFQSIPDWLLLSLSGVLIIAAFPPIPLGFLAYFALIPLIIVFVKDEFQMGFEKGFIFGLFLNLGIMYWLAFNKGTQWYWGTLSMISSVLFLALNYGIIGLIVGYIGRKFGKSAGIWSLPVVWVAIEYIRSFGSLGFTWNNLCYTQCRATQFIQIASIIGPNGISFIIVLVNVLLALAWINYKDERKQSFKYLSAVILLFFIIEIYGAAVLYQADSPGENRKAHVALIQPNVDPNEKWDPESFWKVMSLLNDLTDSAATEPRDLIVWPESATPTYLRRNRGRTLDRIVDHIAQLNTYLVTGAPDYEFTDSADYKVYNSTFLLRPGSHEIEFYRKMKLVPFGEYIPLAEHFPELGNLNLGQGNFDAGTEMKVFAIPLNADTTASTDTTLILHSVVCYESTFPYIVRKGVQKGSEMLVIVSNDAWFGNNSAPYLHMEISRFRAIENRIPVVRSANTGISVICDAYGRILSKADFGERTWLSAELDQGKKKRTIYSLVGNWFGVLNVIGLCGILGISLFRRDQ